MANETAIGWTDLSWNPVHGCSVVSPGCAHCYAATLSLRRGLTKLPWTPANARQNVTVKPKKLGEPKTGGKVWSGLGEAAARAGKTDGKLVFVNSMSDLFHEEVPDEFIAEVWATMLLASKHTFQVLTKRPERMRSLLTSWRFCKKVIAALHASGRANVFVLADILYDEGFDHFENIWLGVSIENRRFVGRADELRATPAAVRFISAEPLLGPLVYDDGCFVHEHGHLVEHRHWADEYTGPELDLRKIDWLIIGGESGPGHRRMDIEWVRDLREHIFCVSNDLPAGKTALFFKQWGGPKPMSGGRELDGREWSEFPSACETHAPQPEGVLPCP